MIRIEQITERRDELLAIDVLQDDETAELAEIQELLDELMGNGGDFQYQGEWYPDYLIPCDDFVDYCKDLLDACGIIPRDLPWFIEIDWESTAENMRHDYSWVSFRGVDYYYR